MRNINTIVIHHSVTPRDLSIDKSIASFSRNHKDRLGQPASKLNGLHVAYHYIISGDGTIKQTRAYDEIGYHAGSKADPTINLRSIGICFTGNFDVENPSSAQIKSGQIVLSNLLKEFPGAKVIGHRDVAGVSKTCPGKNFDIKSLLPKGDKEIILEKLYACLIESIPYLLEPVHAKNLMDQLAKYGFDK